MELSDQVQRLGLTVGRIVTVTEHVGARAPSYLLTIDLGAKGSRECTMPRAGYEAGELEGKQVVCALHGDELLVLAAHSHAGGVVLIRPDGDVEEGTVVG
jgi:tRNA-binding EMAP/Myf-like protein